MTNQQHINHLCTFYVIRTGLWDNFYSDSVFAYCAKAMYKCKKILATICEMCREVHPQDKMLLRIKIHKWNRCQEWSSLSLQHQTISLFLAKLCQGSTVVDKFKQWMGTPQPQPLLKPQCVHKTMATTACQPHPQCVHTDNPTHPHPYENNCPCTETTTQVQRQVPMNKMTAHIQGQPPMSKNNCSQMKMRWQWTWWVSKLHPPSLTPLSTITPHPSLPPSPPL